MQLGERPGGPADHRRARPRTRGARRPGRSAPARGRGCSRGPRSAPAAARAPRRGAGRSRRPPPGRAAGPGGRRRPAPRAGSRYSFATRVQRPRGRCPLPRRSPGRRSAAGSGCTHRSPGLYRTGSAATSSSCQSGGTSWSRRAADSRASASAAVPGRRHDGRPGAAAADRPGTRWTVGPDGRGRRRASRRDSFVDRDGVDVAPVARPEDRDEPTPGLAAQVPQRGPGPARRPAARGIRRAPRSRPVTPGLRPSRSGCSCRHHPRGHDGREEAQQRRPPGRRAPRNPGKGLTSTTTGRPAVISRSTPYSCRPRAAPASRAARVQSSGRSAGSRSSSELLSMDSSALRRRAADRSVADHPHLDVEPVVGGELLGDDRLVAPLGQHLDELRPAAHQAHEVAAGAGAALDDERPRHAAPSVGQVAHGAGRTSCGAPGRRPGPGPRPWRRGPAPAWSRPGGSRPGCRRAPPSARRAAPPAVRDLSRTTSGGSSRPGSRP